MEKFTIRNFPQHFPHTLTQRHSRATFSWCWLRGWNFYEFFHFIPFISTTLNVIKEPKHTVTLTIAHIQATYGRKGSGRGKSVSNIFPNKMLLQDFLSRFSSLILRIFSPPFRCSHTARRWRQFMEWKSIFFPSSLLSFFKAESKKRFVVTLCQ